MSGFQLWLRASSETTELCLFRAQHLWEFAVSATALDWKAVGNSDSATPIMYGEVRGAFQV